MPDHTGHTAPAAARAGTGHRPAGGLAVVALAVLCAAGFLTLAVAVSARWVPLLGLDPRVEPAAHRLVLTHPALLEGPRVITDLGSPVAMLGVHYPADVTAGVLLGAACALGLRPLLPTATPCAPRSRATSTTT